MATRTSVRQPGLDCLRLAGFLAVVVGHTLPGHGVRLTVYWAVPLFFFLSGYLWSDGRSIGAEWRRRYVGLIRPYFAWLAVIGIVIIAFQALTNTMDSVRARLVTMALGGTYLENPFQAYYFPLALAVAVLLFRAVECVSPRRVVRVSVVLVSLVLTCIPQSQELSRLPYAVGLGVVCVGFVAAGRLFRDVRRFVSPVGAAAVLAVAALLVAEGVVLPPDIKYGVWGGPVLAFVVAGAISAALIVLAEALPLRSTPALVATFAPLGLVLILTHGLPIYVLGGHLPEFVVAVASILFAGCTAWAVRNVPTLSGAVSSSTATPRATSRSDPTERDDRSPA